MNCRRLRSKILSRPLRTPGPRLLIEISKPSLFAIKFTKYTLVQDFVSVHPTVQPDCCGVSQRSCSADPWASGMLINGGKVLFNEGGDQGIALRYMSRPDDITHFRTYLASGRFLTCSIDAGR